MASMPPKLSSSNSSSSLSDHFPNLRQFFTRSASQPSQKFQHQQHQPDEKHAHVRSSSVTLSSSSSSHFPMDPDADARAQAFGSCTQVLATAITALFRAINSFGVYSHESADNSTTRSAKLLYVKLLDRAQRERGEWCGFADTSSSSSSGDAQQKKATKSASDILATHLHNLSRDETFALLNELVDVSFRSMRGPLVSAEIYVKHKKPLSALSLGIPVSLYVLLEIRTILNELGRDEKLCIFRLLTLWHAMAVANEVQDLRRTIQEKHHLVFSDCSELEFLTSRRDPRHDAVAIALLQILVLYHDVLFSDVEFLLIKQELQLSDSLRRTRVVSAETTVTTEPTSSESKLESPVDAADQSETSTSPPLPSQDEQSERVDTFNVNGDAAQALPTSPEVGNDVSSSMNQDPRLSEAPSETAVDATLSLPESQSETQSAACEDKYATPEHAAEVEEELPLVQQAPAERSSQQQTPREQQNEPSQIEVAMASSSAQLHSRVSTTTTSRHVHSHTRNHGPVISIRAHSLSPRKSRQTKRFVFEAINASTAITSEKRQSLPRQHNPSASPKSDGARQAMPLWHDVAHITDYFGESSPSSADQQDSKRPAYQTLDPDTAAARRVKQHSLAIKASPVDLPATAASPGREPSQDLPPQPQEDKEVSSSGCNDALQKQKATMTSPTSARRCSSSASALKSSPPHEITDLANTYFSFSFAAATMRTMAIMAFYAIRRHQHQQQ